MGDLRIADLVARVHSSDPTPEVVVLHTEIESEPAADFGYRLWEYNALITQRKGPPVVTIALLPFNVGKGIELARYTETAFRQQYIKLEYWRIPLRGLRAEDYLAAEPALGAALAALMRPATGSMVDLKYAIFSRLRQGVLSPGTRTMLLNVVETYLQLDAREQAEFAARITPEGDTTMGAVEQTWADKLIQQGIEQHAPWVDQIVQQARRDMLLEWIRTRFGAVPEDLAARIAAADSEMLTQLLRRAALANSIEELRKV